MRNAKIFTYDCEKTKTDPTDIVKWMRRNFGERGNGWDFLYVSRTNRIVVEIVDPKIQTMYEMWLNE